MLTLITLISICIDPKGCRLRTVGVSIASTTGVMHQSSAHIDAYAAGVSIAVVTRPAFTFERTVFGFCGAARFIAVFGWGVAAQQ